LPEGHVPTQTGARQQISTYIERIGVDIQPEVAGDERYVFMCRLPSVEENFFAAGILQEPLQKGTESLSVGLVFLRQSIHEIFLAKHRNRQIALRVKIDQQYSVPATPEGIREIPSDRGFSDATLVIENGHHRCHDKTSII
jgi:hypothetical protein